MLACFSVFELVLWSGLIVGVVAAATTADEVEVAVVEDEEDEDELEEVEWYELEWLRDVALVVVCFFNGFIFENAAAETPNSKHSSSNRFSSFCIYFWEKLKWKKIK